jgi:hypothetical protein
MEDDDLELEDYGEQPEIPHHPTDEEDEETSETCSYHYPPFI